MQRKRKSITHFLSQYHGSFSLRHWLQQSDWLPTLEATLALDEECARRVGDDTVGGPAVSRHLRLIRILMRDLLIGVCLLCVIWSLDNMYYVRQCKWMFNAFLLPVNTGELLAQPWTCPY